MNIFYTSKFEKSFQRLPIIIQLLAVGKEKLFRKNLFDPKLRTHKLSWKLNKYWSFSIDYNYRIMFELSESNDVLFINIWDHDIYK